MSEQRTAAQPQACHTRRPCATGVKHPAEGLSVEGVFLIIACIGLAVVMGMILYMINRLRKLRVDPTAFQGLSGQFNELGQLAG